MVPVAHQLDKKETGMFILYKCPSCGQDFTVFGCREKFCHNCGTRINWKHVTMAVAPSSAPRDPSKIRDFLMEINRVQLQDTAKLAVGKEEN